MDDGEIKLIPRAGGRMSRKQKQEYAKAKTEEELSETLKDRTKTREMARAFERRIKDQRRRLGLE